MSTPVADEATVPPAAKQFTTPSRILHWLTAILIFSDAQRRTDGKLSSMVEPEFAFGEITDEIPVPKKLLRVKVDCRHHTSEVKFIEYLLSGLRPRKRHELVDSLIVFYESYGARSYRNKPASVLIHTRTASTNASLSLKLV